MDIRLKAVETAALVVILSIFASSAAAMSPAFAADSDFDVTMSIIDNEDFAEEGLVSEIKMPTPKQKVAKPLNKLNSVPKSANIEDSVRSVRNDSKSIRNKVGKPEVPGKPLKPGKANPDKPAKPSKPQKPKKPKKPKKNNT